MKKEKASKKPSKPSKFIKLKVSYQNEGKSLQEGWEKAPKGTKLVLNGKTLAMK